MMFFFQINIFLQDKNNNLKINPNMIVLIILFQQKLILYQPKK